MAICLGAFYGCGETGAVTLDDTGPIPPLTFDSPETISTTEGHTTLRWDADGSLDGEFVFQLQEADNTEFLNASIRYEGKDLAVFVSGLENGDTYYRVRAVGAAGRKGAWSEPVAVVVAYPRQTTVFWLMILGSVVFVLTVSTIVVGHVKTRQEQKAS